MPVALGVEPDAAIAGVDAIAVSPGVDRRAGAIAQAAQRGVPVVGDVELFAQALAQRGDQTPVIAITGSNGKSTVTAMAGEICAAGGLRPVIAGNIEAELAQMSDDDAAVFMEDLGITEPARNRVIRMSYDLLGLMSFLTAGEDEVRAWTIRRNTPAVEAAGAIHSDIQRGFIRAEVVAFDDLMKAGTMVDAKKAGTVRLEGKLYIVKDGDICHFLFNV
jgi:hypothetical protein